MNFINLNCPPLPYFIVGGGCVYRPGDIHERRTIRNVFDLIYVHSGTLYLEQDPFRVELNAGQFFIITPDTPHRGSRVCQEKTTTSWVHFYTNGKYSLSDEFYPDNAKSCGRSESFFPICRSFLSHSYYFLPILLSSRILWFRLPRNCRVRSFSASTNSPSTSTST